MNTYKRLTRSTTHRMLTGLCGGIGEYFNIDPTIVRVLFVLGFFAGLHIGTRDRLRHHGADHSRSAGKAKPVNNLKTTLRSPKECKIFTTYKYERIDTCCNLFVTCRQVIMC